MAAAAIAAFTLINALGVRTGAYDAERLHGAEDCRHRRLRRGRAILRRTGTGGAAVPRRFRRRAATFAAIGLAIVPVLFAYSGWQTASFMSAELKEPAKTLPRGL